MSLRKQRKGKLLNSLLSPAKLNLFFRVLSRRKDGYHEIASLYQAISLADRLFFSFKEKDQITCSNPSIPCDERNLVFQALHLFRSKVFIGKVSIHIDKQIPVEAGLGGGSSNAAATLWGLNRLAGSPLSTSQLMEMGSLLGSDVPFFFSTGTAYCTGRGEKIEPFHLREKMKGWIAKPSYGLSTPLVYRHTVLERLPIRDLSKPCFFNDLEVAAFQIEKRLKPLKNELEKSFKTVVMTGSGTAFFCLEGKPPLLENVFFYPFESITRNEEWYQ